MHLTLACAFAENGCINTSTILFKSHYNKNFIELAYSARIGEYWSRSFLFCKFMDRAEGVPNTDRTK